MKGMISNTNDIFCLQVKKKTESNPDVFIIWNN